MSFIKSTGELGEGGVLDGDVVVIPEIICQATSANLGPYIANLGFNVLIRQEDRIISSVVMSNLHETTFCYFEKISFKVC